MTETPKSWVACMGCYSEFLIGRWFDAASAPTEMRAFEAQVPLGRAEDLHRAEGHDELWVLDSQGFEGWLNGEFAPAVGVHVATLIASIRQADVDPALVAHWAEHAGHQPAAMEWDAPTSASFEDAFLGVFDDLAAYAEGQFEDSPTVAALPDEVRNNINWANIGRDWEFSGEIYTMEVEENDGEELHRRIAVFDGRTN